MKKIAKSSANINKLIFVSPKFEVSLFPLLLFINNDGKLFINKLKNIVLNILTNLYAE